MVGKVEVQENDEFLTVTVDGEFTTEFFLSTMNRIMKECQDRKKNRVLVDMIKLRNWPKDMSRFYVGEKLAEMVGNKIKIAALVREELIDGYFAETVAVNRGVRVKVFTSRELAVEFLSTKKR